MWAYILCVSMCITKRCGYVSFLQDLAKRTRIENETPRTHICK